LFSVDWRKRLLHFGAHCLRIIPEVFKVCLKLATSFHRVIFADDVVPVKDGASLVTGNSHGYFLGHLASVRVAHGAATQVLEPLILVNHLRLGWGAAGRLAIRPPFGGFHLPGPSLT